MSGSNNGIRRPFAALALACGLAAAASVLLPWATGFRWSERGYEHPEGVILLVAAINAALASAIAAGDRTVGRTGYARWAAPSGVVMLAAAVWFRVTVVGDADARFDLLVNCFTYPCAVIHAGYGLSLAIIASAAYLVSLALSLASTPPLRSPASDWPVSPPAPS